MPGFEVKVTGDFADLGRKVKQLTQQKMVELSEQYQAVLDDLARTQAGTPAEQIKPLLRSRWQSVGGDITDRELTTYARQIAAGRRIVMQVQDLQ